MSLGLMYLEQGRWLTRRDAGTDADHERMLRQSGYPGLTQAGRAWTPSAGVLRRRGRRRGEAGSLAAVDRRAGRGGAPCAVRVVVGGHRRGAGGADDPW